MVGSGSSILEPIISAVITVGLILMVLVAGVTWWFTHTDKIESDELIVPEIKLVIRENQVDTIYVYRK